MRNRSIKNYNPNSKVSSVPNKVNTSAPIFNRKLPVSVAASESTRMIQNRPSFLKGSLPQLNYVDERFGLDTNVDHKFSQTMVDAAYNPYITKKYEAMQKDVANKLTSKYVDKKFGGGLLQGLSKAVPYLASAAGSIFNVAQTDKIKTNRKPVLAKYNATPYKDTTSDIVDRNTAAYSGFIGSADPGIGTAQKTSMFGKLLDANTQVGIAGAQQRNQFGLAESSRQGQMSMQNANMSNAIGERNITRYNDKIAARTNAVNAGVQDIINVDAQRQARNSQSDEMLLKFAETADTGTMDRKAQEMGFMDGAQMLEIVGNPNINTSEWLKRNADKNFQELRYNARSTPSALSRKGIGITNKYSPNLPDTLPIT